VRERDCPLMDSLVVAPRQCLHGSTTASHLAKCRPSRISPGKTEPVGNLPEYGDEDRRKHLEFIQSVLSRMSTASTVAKGWCLTVVTAAIGFSIIERSRTGAALAFVAAALFGVLDVRYLREERKFRQLFDHARRGEVECYDMDASSFADPDSAQYCDDCRWWSVARSWAVWSFYVPLLLLALVAGARAFFR